MSISLKDHREFNEKWLQDRIAEDPTILGLGDVSVLERERTQERAGRLDILLSNPEQDRRYEVELMLGKTDESHIIRCIEYWDIERQRYPGAPSAYRAGAANAAERQAVGRVGLGLSLPPPTLRASRPGAATPPQAQRTGPVRQGCRSL